MSILSLQDPSSWIRLLRLLAFLVIGGGLGTLYFRSLRWSVYRLTDGRRIVPVIALMVGRFALLGGLLTLASLQGALPLLLMALGILIARVFVMRWSREAPL